MTKPIDLSKPVQTRSGLPVRILCTDRKHAGYPVIGLRTDADGVEDILSWTANGSFDKERTSSPEDLVQVPQPRKHAELIKRWANDESVRIKYRSQPYREWSELSYPDFDPEFYYEEILPGDPLY